VKPLRHENTSNGSKLDALRKREAALREAITKEKIREEKAKAKVLAREFASVGETLCKHAAQSRDFHSTLRQMIAAAIAAADEPTRKFLASRGWL
jgi:hypothetical protein